MQIILHLLWEDRQLNVDAVAVTVRPPVAPTTAAHPGARTKSALSRTPEAMRALELGKPWATTQDYSSRIVVSASRREARLAGTKLAVAATMARTKQAST